MDKPELIAGVGYDLEAFRASLPEGKQHHLDNFLSSRSVASTPLLRHDGTGDHPEGAEKHLIYAADYEQFIQEAHLA